MKAADFTLSYKLPDTKKFTAGAAKVMREFGHEYLTRLVETHLSGRTGDMGLNRRSGNLARDWVTTVEEKAVGPVLTVKTHGTADKYAGLQERGGTVRPVHAKNLWIPLPANQTPKGVARISPREAIAQGGFISWRRGGVFFARPLVKTARKNTTHGLVPLFVLKKSVTVLPRMGAESLFRDMLPLLEIGLLAEAQGAWNG